MLGTAVYAAGVGVFGVALGFLLRSAAGAIGVLVTLLLVAPVLIGLVPGTVGDWISKLLPGNAGQAIMHVTTQSGQLSAWTGLAVFAAGCSGSSPRRRWRCGGGTPDGRHGALRCRG